MKTRVQKDVGILVLIDMVEFTPQAVEQGGFKTAKLSRYFEQELRLRALPRRYKFIKSIGDAALLFGKEPMGLIDLMLDLFARKRIAPHLGFEIRLRMVAHHGFFYFVLDEAGRYIDAQGSEAIKAFRIEKRAETWRLLVTDSLFAGVQDLLEPNLIEHRISNSTSRSRG